MVDRAGSAAPAWRIPSVQLITIEYPGVISETKESLERALATLSPYAGPGCPLQSASSALAHLAHVLARGGKLIECRLAPLAGEDESGSLYRHPILGDVVPGYELVVRLRKRVWQRQNTEGHTETRKAYTLTLLGAVRSTVRFVRMADFAFKPDPPAGSTIHPTEALHRALVQMDANALQQFRFAPETEEYEVPDEKNPEILRSNLAMIPPPFFSRMELPFNYGYRQNPASSLQTVSSTSTAKRARKTVRKGQADMDHAEPDERVVTRYLNRSRWRNMAPVAVKFAQSDAVPTGPDEALARVTFSDRQQALLEKLDEHFAVRPVWSRLSLLNQFRPSDARVLVQAKELFAVAAYTFADGPWRDTLVRFGYDPRKEPESRFFQRIHLRGKAPRNATARGIFRAEYGDVLQGPREPESTPVSDARPATHIFDGKHAALSTSTFQLCDITDITIVPLIRGEGDNNLRTAPDNARVSSGMT
ncbi:tau 95 subunit of transcription factor TFIIIC [Malassezia brasiliensis]|uniref:Tau 95 subunit of transcription factor TFIIIC n=1 Tax=Malassezia brasiliensis TaxID=1821822 RepID=A0AAF0DQW4_9BASI|nr:tau 95 subunit of transcription factor TFIIIC [Malassezia brasiliensis]